MYLVCRVKAKVLAGVRSFGVHLLQNPSLWHVDVLMDALSIPEDPCPRTRPWSARTGPRTGVLGNGKRTQWYSTQGQENILNIVKGN